MQKKLLAVLLSVLLIVTSFWTMFTFTSSASSLNLITNGDFEQTLTTDNIYPQSVAVADAQTQMAANAGKWGKIRSGVTRMDHTAVTAQNGSAVNGNYFLTSGATTDGNGYVRTFGQFVYLAAGDYTLSFIYKNDTADRFRAGVYTIGCETTEANAAYTVKTGFLPVQSAWTEHTITFTITEAKYYMVGFGSNINPSSGTFSIDNVTLIKTVNLIQNGDFANNDLSKFSSRQKGGDGAYTLTANGENDYYLSADAGLAFYTKEKVHLEAGTSYTMSFDFRFTDSVVSTYDSFYRAGFVADNAIDLGSAAFKAVGGTYNPANPDNYYSIYPHQAGAPANWKTHSFTFVPSADVDVYAVVGTYNEQGGSDFELDNWRLGKTADYVTVTATADGNGTVTGGGKALPGDKLILTAKADAGSVFKGWYLDGAATPVSTDENYVHTVTGAASLVAKFELNTPGAITNYIKNGDFEQEISTTDIHPQSIGMDPAVSQAQMAANAGVWGRIRSGATRMDRTAVTLENGAEANGDYFLTSGATDDSNGFIRTFGQFVRLTPGDYVLSFLSTCNTADRFRAGIYSMGCEATLDSESKNYHVKTMFIPKNDEWTLQSLAFTITEEKYYMVGFGGNTNGVGQNFTIDNVALNTAKDYYGEVTNFVKNGDFEQEISTTDIHPQSIGMDPAVSQAQMAANAGVWGRIRSGATRMDRTAVTPENGIEANENYFLTSGGTDDSNGFIRTFGQFMRLAPGDYVLSFMSTCNTADRFRAGIYSMGCEATQDSESKNYHVKTMFIPKTDDWALQSMAFTITEEKYYMVGFGSNTNGVGQLFTIDNVVICPASEFITVTATTDGGGKVTHPMNIQKVGDEATVTATPDEGYVFQGWFVGDDLVSSNTTYSFEVTKSVSLVAQFAPKSEDGKIVANGDFETGTTARWQVVQTAAGSSISVVDDAEHQSKVLKIDNAAYALYQKVNVTKGTEYIISFDAKFDDPSAVPDRVISFYRMGFVKDPAGGLSGSNFIGPKEDSLYPNQYYSIFNNLPKDNMEGWNSYSSNYIATKDGAIWFAIGCFNTEVVSGWSIDNIAITPKDQAVMFKAVAVSASGSGKVTSSQSGVVAPNSNVRVTATANPGSKFDGWYLNGTKLSDAETYTYTVVSSVNIYARFVDATNPDANQLLDNSDFATGDLTGWGLNNVSYSDPDIVYAKVDGKDIALVGESGMLYQTVALEPFTTYVARVTSRIPDFDKITEGNMRNFYRVGLSKLEAPNVLQSGSLNESAYTHAYLSYLDTSIQGSTAAKYVATKDWRTYTYTYTNNSPDVMLVNVVVGAPYCNVADLEIQKFEFYAYANGVVDWAPKALYGEAFYNAVTNAGFEKATTDADWGKTLPSGWSIQKGHTETGNKYLSVSGTKSKIYQIPVDGAATYMVSFSLRTAKKGSASISIVDAKGNPLGDSFGTNDNLAIFQPIADNTWQRMGAHIFVENDGKNQSYVYLKISGGTNTLDIDDVMISMVGYNTHETFVDFTVPEFDYDNPVYYDPTVMYPTDAKPNVDGTVADGELMGSGTENNADTGDDMGSLLPILLIGILLPCAVCLVLTAKRTKKSEKEAATHE